MARLIDTSVLIEVERRGQPPDAIDAIGDGEDLAVASITAAELLVGVHRAASLERRLRREAFVNLILERLTVVAFDLRIARIHAQIWAELAEAGQLISPYDLLIAATALAHGYDLLTLNVRDFGRVPGLVVLTPSW